MATSQRSGETYAATELAAVLNTAAQRLADAATQLREIAQQAAGGRVGDTGYLYLANRALGTAVNLLPNLGLGLAFQQAADADKLRERGE